MQKTQQDNSVKYRLLTDGRRWKVQAHEEKLGWYDQGIFSLKWLAKWRIEWLKAIEATRRRDSKAVWEVEK